MPHGYFLPPDTIATEFYLFQLKFIKDGYLRTGNFTPVPTCDITTTMPTADRGMFFNGTKGNMCIFNIHGVSDIYPLTMIYTQNMSTWIAFSNGANGSGFIVSGSNVEFEIGEGG